MSRRFGGTIRVARCLTVSGAADHRESAALVQAERQDGAVGRVVHHAGIGGGPARLISAGNVATPVTLKALYPSDLEICGLSVNQYCSVRPVELAIWRRATSDYERVREGGLTATSGRRYGVHSARVGVKVGKSSAAGDEHRISGLVVELGVQLVAARRVDFCRRRVVERSQRFTVGHGMSILCRQNSSPSAAARVGCVVWFVNWIGVCERGTVYCVARTVAASGQNAPGEARCRYGPFTFAQR
jgi:hypothetical protein